MGSSAHTHTVLCNIILEIKWASSECNNNNMCIFNNKRTMSAYDFRVAPKKVLRVPWSGAIYLDKSNRRTTKTPTHTKAKRKIDAKRREFHIISDFVAICALLRCYEPMRANFERINTRTFLHLPRNRHSSLSPSISAIVWCIPARVCMSVTIKASKLTLTTRFDSIRWWFLRSRTSYTTGPGSGANNFSEALKYSMSFSMEKG